MTFKKTIGSLAFVLAASVSSIAVAQGLSLGAATNAQVGVGIAPSGFNPNASINNSSGTTIGTGLDAAAAAQTNTHDTQIKTSKPGRTGHAKTSARAKIDAGANTKLQVPN